KGSNAWDHLVEVMQALEAAGEHDGYDEGEAPPIPRAAAFSEAVEGLSDWIDGLAETDPTDAELEAWMSETTMLAEALKRAENCDSFVPVARPGEDHWPGYDGVAVLPRLRLINAIIGRYKLLVQSGNRK